MGKWLESAVNAFMRYWIPSEHGSVQSVYIVWKCQYAHTAKTFWLVTAQCLRLCACNTVWIMRPSQGLRLPYKSGSSAGGLILWPDWTWFSIFLVRSLSFSTASGPRRCDMYGGSKYGIVCASIGSGGVRIKVLPGAGEVDLKWWYQDERGWSLTEGSGHPDYAHMEEMSRAALVGLGWTNVEKLGPMMTWTLLTLSCSSLSSLSSQDQYPGRKASSWNLKISLLWISTLASASKSICWRHKFSKCRP